MKQRKKLVQQYWIITTYHTFTEIITTSSISVCQFSILTWTSRQPVWFDWARKRKMETASSIEIL